MSINRSEPEGRRPSFPSLNIPRLSLTLVLATMMTGQVVMMDELGVWVELKELYQLTIWFAFLYGFYPQVRWVCYRVLFWVTDALSSEVSSQ